MRDRPDAPYPFALPGRCVIAVSGPDAVHFLQGLLTQDLRLATPERCLWSALLSPQGKFLHEMFIWRHGQAVLLETSAERSGDLLRRLALYRLRAKAEMVVTDAWTSCACLDIAAYPALVGLAEGSAVALPEGGVAAVDPRHAAMGLRLLLPREQSIPIDDATLHIWNRRRISLGIPDGQRDMIIDRALLLEHGFDALHGVAWDKGCYVGQELTARTHYRALVKKRLCPVAISGAPPDMGDILYDASGLEVGEMRSHAGDLGLALLRVSAIRAGEPLRAGETLLQPEPPDWMTFPEPSPEN
jgi:folate-binding protein YgfZ